MSTMQNYRISRSPCGNQRCDDKPSDGSIQGKGRSNDKQEFKRILLLEESSGFDSRDVRHYKGDDSDGFGAAFYSTKTGGY